MLARTCCCARRLGGTGLRRVGAADRKPHRRWARWCNCACNAAHRSRALLDIPPDFLVFAAGPVGFAPRSPHPHPFCEAFLLASFVANGSAFLAFSIMAEKRGITTTRQGQKSIYYLAGIAEGFETIAFMIAFCLFPTAFPILAIIFATLCWISALSRLV